MSFRECPQSIYLFICFGICSYLPFGSRAQHPAEDATSKREIKPGVAQRVPLPTKLGRIASAKYGEWIVLDLPESDKIALYDLKQMTWGPEFPRMGADTQFAASNRHLIIASGVLGTLQVIDLENKMEAKELNVEPFGILRSVVMAPDGSGEVYFFSSEQDSHTNSRLIRVLDPYRMEFRYYKGDLDHRVRVHGSRKLAPPPRIPVEENRLLHKDPSSPHRYVLKDGIWEYFKYSDLDTPLVSEPYKHEMYLEEDQKVLFIPALRPPYELRIIPPADPPRRKGVEKEAQIQAEIRIRGLRQSLALFPLGDIQQFHVLNYYVFQQAKDGEVLYSPDAGVLVHPNQDRKFLWVYDVDVHSVLKTLPFPYLFIDSMPPLHARVSELFRYPLRIQGNQPPFHVRLLGGPADMHVTDDGELEWLPRFDHPEECTVILEVRDREGNRTEQMFRLSTEGTLVNRTLTDEPLSDQETIHLPVNGQTPGLHSISQPGEFPELRSNASLRLPAQAERILLGGDQNLLALWMPKIAFLLLVDLQSGEPLFSVTTGHPDVLIALGYEDLVLFDQRYKRFDHIDLQTQKLQHSARTPLSSVEVRSIHLSGVAGSPLLVTTREQNPQALLMDPKTLRLLPQERQPPQHSRKLTQSTYKGIDVESAFRFPAFAVGNEHYLILGPEGEAPRWIHLEGGRRGLKAVQEREILYRMGFTNHFALREGYIPKDHERVSAVDAPYSLLVVPFLFPHHARAQHAPYRKAELYADGNPEALYEFPSVVHNVQDRQKRTFVEQPPLRERLILSVQGKRLVTLDPDQAGISIRPFDLFASLKHQEADYLFAEVPPDIQLPREGIHSFRMKVHSRHPIVSARATSELEGFTAYPDGNITWTPLTPPPAGQHDLVIAYTSERGFKRSLLLKVWVPETQPPHDVPPPAQP